MYFKDSQNEFVFKLVGVFVDAGVESKGMIEFAISQTEPRIILQSNNIFIVY